MRKHTSKLFCIGIAIFVFICGMHFEEIPADYLSAGASSLVPFSHFSQVDAAITDIQVSTQELSGIHSRYAWQSALRTMHLKKDNKLFSHFLCENVFSLFLQKTFAGFRDVPFVVVRQEEVIASYIHKSDGKKRL